MTGQAPTPLLSAGRVIAGRYELVEPIGEGGMGVVYRARHLAMDRPVALKVIHPSTRGNTDAVKRFRREMKTTSRINHPNVIRVTDFGETEEGQFYLAMELLHGETLRARMDREGKLPVTDACRIGQQILGALGAAHAEGIVHRDLKPENIMLVPVYGQPDQVRVLDFGIARFVEGSDETSSSLHVTLAGMFVGTPHYASPEQISGDPIDGRADLYAFGVLFYRMVTGQLPFDTDGHTLKVLRMHLNSPVVPPTEVDPALPPWIDGVVARLLAKYPDERPAHAEEVMAELDQGSTPAPAPDRQAAPEAQSRGQMALIVGSATVAALVAAGFGWLLGYLSGTAPPLP